MKTSDLIQIPLAMVPDRVALTFEGIELTFEQFNERVNRLSSALAELGVEKGDRVSIIQVNTHRVVETYFATAKLAAICVPLNYRAKAEELNFMINSAEPTVLMVGERYIGMVESLKPSLPSVKHYVAMEAPKEGWLYYEDFIAKGSPEGVEREADDDDTTVLMYTAGTTGFPKGVMLTHGNLSSYALSNVNPPDLESHDVNLLVVPLYHIAGTQGMMASIYGGRTLALQRQFVAEEWLQGVQEQKVTHSVLVPTMLKMFIEHPDFAKYDLSSLRQITYGAAPMPFEVIKKAVELLPHVRFINAFGQTETASTVTALGPDDHDIPADLPEAEKEKKLRRLATSIGRPLPDTEVKVFDEITGEELPPGKTGEIWARGPRAMSGYWKMPEATASTKTADGWVRTGDLGYYDEEGYFYLAGRAKDIIIRGGENIAPEEIENVLYSHPQIEEAAVIGVPDEEWGEEIRAIVVPKQGQSPDPEEIMEFCRQRIASFKRPRSVVFIDELPRNPMGKVLKRVLREQYGQP